MHFINALNQNGNPKYVLNAALLSEQVKLRHVLNTIQMFSCNDAKEEADIWPPNRTSCQYVLVDIETYEMDDRI